MSIRQAIQGALLPCNPQRYVRDVRLGLGYTAVQLDDNRTGLAYTLGKEHMGGCSALGSLRPLAGKTAGELLKVLDSSNTLESAVGLATANAIANLLPRDGIPGDVLNAATLLPTDRVVMIGYFAPLVAALERRSIVPTIFDDHNQLGDHSHPPDEAYESLLNCDVALITATAILNGTIDRLLESATHCRETVMLGSSTPLVPEAFAGTPVTLLSGITVTDSEAILRVVSEGGGTRSFKGFVTKWNVRLRDTR